MRELVVLGAAVSSAPDGLGWLAEPERAIFGGLVRERRRADWRLGRWAAKQVAARVLDITEHARLAILAAPDGAPEVWVDGQRAAITITLSHRSGRAIAFAAPGEVQLGGDLEAIEPRDQALVEDFFTPAEQRTVEAAGPERPLRIAQIWSAKESALKALREGLRRDTREVEVELGALDPAEGEAWRPLRLSVDAGQFFGWWRRERNMVLTVAAAEPFAAPSFLGP